MVYQTFEISESLSNKINSYARMFEVNQKDLVSKALDKFFANIEKDKTDSFIEKYSMEIAQGIDDIEKGDFADGSLFFSEILGL